MSTTPMQAGKPVSTRVAHVDRLTGDMKRHARFGLLVCLLLVGGLGGWSAMAKIAGAVIAPGFIVVDGSSKKVQHPTGGIVGEIKVKLGDRVTEGDLLVRLDETQVRATLGIVQSQLVQSIARKARLEAERGGARDLHFPTGFETESAEAAEAARGERRLFQARRTFIEGQQNQYRERVTQLEKEIEGLTVQRTSKKSELDLQWREMTRLEALYAKQLVNEARMSTTKRDGVRLQGDLGSLTSQIARAKAQISQTEMQILQIDQEQRTDSQKELRDVEARIGELSERRIAALDQLRRVDIRAPINGTVHEMNVHTVGGVVGQGETLMLIVPSSEPLAVEARISPVEIDQVAIGRKARLRFTAFNQRTTPEVDGTVSHVSADLSKDSQTGQSYFLVRVRFSNASLGTLSEKALHVVPGMPVEAFIETGERTALSYFTKPLADSFRRTFRER